MTQRKENNTLIENSNNIKTILMLLVVLSHATALWSSNGWFNQPAVNKSQFLNIITNLYLKTIKNDVFQKKLELTKLSQIKLPKISFNQIIK